MAPKKTRAVSSWVLTEVKSCTALKGTA
jgi:hypothetical protein